MLLLASSTTTSTGTLSRAKKADYCRTPSSKTPRSSCPSVLADFTPLPPLSVGHVKTQWHDVGGPVNVGPGRSDDGEAKRQPASTSELEGNVRWSAPGENRAHWW